MRSFYRLLCLLCLVAMVAPVDSAAASRIAGSIGAPPIYQGATNIAIGKVASQVSTEWGGVAGRAVDGNTSGNYADNSVTHTGGHTGAWWQVDLGQIYQIDSVTVWNRTDCCGDRLQNFDILVSDDGTHWQSSYYVQAQPNPSTAAPLSQAGRYVRVQLRGTNNLSLAEVQVFGTPITPPAPLPGVNLTAGKSATQSSTALGGDASRAIDGDTNGHWNDNSVSHTAYTMNPWWQVDLGQVHQIGKIAVWNRTDCCAGRLQNFAVRVSDDGTTWQDFNVTPIPLPTAVVAADRSARYVQIRLSGENVLSLAEVQVFAFDTQRPTGSITVAPRPYTRNALVTLTLSATDDSGTVSQMRIWTDEVVDTGWITYATSYLWTFSIGDGPRTVFAQFKDATGNISTIVQDTTTLDTTSPTTSLSIGLYPGPDPQPATNPQEIQNSFVDVDVTASDAGSGVASIALDVALGSDPFAYWHTISQSGRRRYVNAPHNATYQFGARATDNATNVSSYATSVPVFIRLYAFRTDGVGRTFTYAIDSASLPGYSSLVSTAMDRWRASGLVTITEDPNSLNKILISDNEDIGGACGRYFPPASTGTGGFRIVLRTYNNTRCGPANDVRLSVAVHEIGHALGLDDRPWGEVQIMGYKTDPTVDTLQPADIQGLAALP